MPADMKQIIADTFIALSKRKNVDKITVKDIVESCNISRQTFYYHFQDIAEVIEWSIEQTLKHLSLEDDLYKTIRSFIMVTVENRAQRKCIVNSQRRDYIEWLMVKNLRACLVEIVRRYPVVAQIDYANREVALDFCAWGLAGFLMQNDSVDNCDIDRMTHQVYQMLSCFIADLPEIHS